MIGEVEPGPSPITGVPTSTAGFLGETERGPILPTLITSWSDFATTYGGYIDSAPSTSAPAFLPYAVRGFFENGGQRLFVARVTGVGTSPARLDDYLGAAAGDPASRRGLAGLLAIDSISLVTAPDDVLVTGLRAAVIAACESARDRFAITSANAGTSDSTASPFRPPHDTSYGALYYPWIRVAAPHLPAGHRLVPPTGHIAGVYARVDVERGVHVAPANELVRGIATGNPATDPAPLEYTLGSREHAVLNPRGINVIRDFRSARRGIRVWGARTMSADSEWKYISVRRLMIFLEQSIDRGIRWVAFEPNSEPTWIQVRLAIANFLRTVWRTGALLGRTEREAYFVKCDRTTMTQDDIDNGRLVCVVGVAPVRPAEFVIVRFSVKTNDS